MSNKAKFIFTILILMVAAPVSAQTSLSVSNTANTNAYISVKTNNHEEVIQLGEAKDPKTGQKVQGMAIVHYKGEKARAAEPKPLRTGERCNDVIRKGLKLKVVEPWVFNGSNNQGLDSSALFNNVSSNISKWEDAADGVIGNGGLNIVGDGQNTSAALSADYAGPDGQNEVYFGEIPGRGAVGITLIWGYFSGRTENREIIEWDQVFDQTDYSWSTSGAGDKMDFESVSTHELGHTFGLDDLSSSRCTGETMYGRVSNGQTNKRVLQIGDITGINQLY